MEASLPPSLRWMAVASPQGGALSLSHCNPRHSVGMVGVWWWVRGVMFLPHDVKNKVVIHSVGEGCETDQGQEMIKAGRVCSSAVVVRIGCQQVTRAGFSSVLTPKYSWINIQIIYC